MVSLKAVDTIDILQQMAQRNPSLGTAAARAVLETLVAWDGNMTVGSKVSTGFNELWRELSTLASRETGATYWSDVGFFLNAMWKDPAYGGAGPADPACVALGFSNCGEFAFSALANVAAKYGTDLSGALGWGALPDDNSFVCGGVHAARYTHLLLGSTPLGCLFNRCRPHGGDDSCVNVGAYDYSTFLMTAGSSYREVIDFSNLDDSLFVHGPGQSGNVFSPDYDNYADLWARGQYLPMRMP